MKRLIALCLALCLLLCGCSGAEKMFRALYRGRGAFARAVADVQNYDAIRPFSEMPYKSPDARELNDAFGRARTLAERGEDAEALIAALDRAFWIYDNFYTLDTIAMIRSDSDQSDAYYRDEYNRCEIMSAQVEQWREQMLHACAVSKLRPALERSGYFAPGDLDYYEQEDSFDDALMALYQRESELLADYRALIADDAVEIDGEKMSLDEYLARESLSEEEYQSAYLAWLERVNGEIADIYAELIGVRLDIAAKLGYDSYEQYCYDMFGRDYTPEEANAWLEEIRQVLGPYREELVARGEYDRICYPDLSERQLMDRLREVMEELGEPAAEAFDFMEEYELCSVSADLRKAATSYTVYLFSYDTPYLFVDAYGDVEDLLTTGHEFGHFLAAYSQGLWSAPLDLDETWSQGMEFLVLEKLYGKMSQYNELLRIKLLNAVEDYTSQAAYCAFEQAVYELPEEERTAERFNELSLACMRDYGQVDGDEATAAMWWTQVEHIFEFPFYIVSYCTSADAAMQLYQLALDDPDAAWEAYQILLEDWDIPYADALEDAGLESPMTPGHAARARETIEAQLPD